MSFLVQQEPTPNLPLAGDTANTFIGAVAMKITRGIV